MWIFLPFFRKPIKRAEKYELNVARDKSRFVQFIYVAVLFSVLVIALGLEHAEAQDTPFITTWKVESGDLQISIPMFGDGYDFTINWGDGEPEETYANSPGNVKHVLDHIYSSEGEYEVKISGDFPRIVFHLHQDSNKIVSIDQWGDIEWQSMASAFSGASNLTYNATDTPDLNNVTTLEGMFAGAFIFNGDISDWNVSNVTNMSGMFRGAQQFNQALNDWETSNVTSMRQMFMEATSFNQNLNNWNTGSVTDMERMFFEISFFNGDISSWDVSNVTNMSEMFFRATSFNGEIGNWDTGKVEDMSRMFSGATSFNQNLNNWNVSNVINMSMMFRDARSFNGNISSWNVLNATNMSEMFLRAINFRTDISGWTTTAVEDMQGMFFGAEAFNRDLGNWDITSVTDMTAMLSNSSISQQNYDNTLIGWNGQAVQSNVEMGADGLEYCDGKDARQNLISGFSWTITGDSEAAGCDFNPFRPFITTWKVEPGDLQISIPMFGNGYDFTIDWGDGEPEETYTNSPGNVKHVLDHVYSSEGEYEVKISGDFPQINFSGSDDQEKILSVEQWGDIEWQSMGGAFSGASNLTYNATDTPDLSNVTTLRIMFAGASKFNGDISDWNVSTITNMNAMFYNAEQFNQDLNDWETSNVTNMRRMFNNATSFNGEIGEWETGKVEDMSSMFFGATSFNQNLNNWDTGSVADMNRMFQNAEVFNGNISDWDVKKVADMTRMFWGATAFNADIGDWQTDSVVSLDTMFRSASSFNQDIGSWNVSNVTNMRGMFIAAVSFNQNLNNWATGNVTDMGQMFGSASSFNQDISDWNVEKVIKMDEMFSNASVFNGDISEWDVSNVETMLKMFSDAEAFNGDISEWDVSAVKDFSKMFERAKSFNADISGWKTTSAEVMNYMFLEAIDFNQDLGNWDITSVRDMVSMLNNTSLSVENYDNTLIGWNSQAVLSNVELGADGLEYCDGEAARQKLISGFSWVITGDSEAAGCNLDAFRPFITIWKTDNPGNSEVNQIRIPMIGNGYDFTIDWGDGEPEEAYSNNPGSNVEHFLEHTYTSAGEYEVAISGDFPRIYFNNGNNGGDHRKIVEVKQWGDLQWSSMVAAFWGAENLNVTATDAPDLSSVENMSFMFTGNKKLNSDLNHWNVSEVRNMNLMFTGASAFNGDISDWETGNVIIMASMFQGAVEFNQDIGDWDVSNVENMFQMFLSAFKFNGDISKWEVHKVENMTNMFRSAKVFNQNISGWNTGSVIFMIRMFQDAEKFDQNLGGWDLGSITSLENALNNSGMSQTNYDNTLNGWRDFVTANNAPQNIDLGADGLKYCDAKDARDDLINNFSWTITGDSEAAACREPTADDNTVMVFVNGYEFTGSDFGQTDPDASVKITSLPTKADLLDNGSPVSVDDVITIADVNNGNLSYTPGNGLHGYNFDSFEFKVISPAGTESSDAYTMTIHAAARSLTLGNTEGWRFLTSPADEDSYDEFLAPLSIGGIPGSTNPGASFATLYELDQINYEWQAVSNMTNKIERGKGFIVRVEADDANSELTAGDEFFSLENEYSFSGLFYDLNQGPEGDSHFLVGNPHPISLDFCEFTETNIAASVDIWDPDANGGNGDYMNVNCASDDVHIAPFQAFWIRTTNNNPSLSIPEEAYLESMADGFFKEKEKSPDNFIVRLNVTSEDEIFSNRVNILFSDEGTVEMDRYDAPKRSAAGWAQKWISFYSLDVNNRPFAMQSLPLKIEEKVSIPMDIQTTESGRFTLEWELPESHLFNGSYFLRDNQTGGVIELREGSSYSFEINPAQPSKGFKPLEGSGKERSAKFPKNFADLGEGSNPRFELLIAGTGVDGFTELGAIPEAFGLAQNYPNPFNPTTVISYQLPVNSEVRLEVYDMLGRNVATLVNGQVAAGRHTVNFEAGNLSSGIYLYRLQAGSQIMTRKLTVVK